MEPTPTTHSYNPPIHLPDTQSIPDTPESAGDDTDIIDLTSDGDDTDIIDLTSDEEIVQLGRIKKGSKCR